MRFDTPEQLPAAEISLGIDGTALVQEFLPARGWEIVLARAAWVDAGGLEYLVNDRSG